jgi:hypothetical protein
VALAAERPIESVRAAPVSIAQRKLDEARAERERRAPWLAMALASLGAALGGALDVLLVGGPEIVATDRILFALTVGPVAGFLGRLVAMVTAIERGPRAHPAYWLATRVAVACTALAAACGGMAHGGTLRTALLIAACQGFLLAGYWLWKWSRDNRAALVAPTSSQR